jgi:hypothetical protein
MTTQTLSQAPARTGSVFSGSVPLRLPLAVVASIGLAILVGVLGTTQYGFPVFVGLLVLGLFALGIVTCLKDPVLALLGLWIFEVIDLPASSFLGYYSSTGEVIRQADEALVVVLLVLTLRSLLRSTTPLPPLRYLVPGIGVALCGIVSGILHGVPSIVLLVGGFLGLKLWIMITLTLVLPWRRSDVDRVYKVLTSVGLIIAVVGILDYASNHAISHFLHTSVNQTIYRSEAVQSIFPTPGEFSLFMSLMFGITFARFSRSLRTHDLLLALLFAANVVLSLRLKGFLSLTAVGLIVGIVSTTSNPRRAIAALGVGTILVFGAYQLEQSVISKQVSTYTSTDTSARSRLYSTGEQIASESFPLGLGFGRFASYMSHTHYSPAYYKYGLSRVYGLSPQHPNFIEDTSWPSVFGETGYGGAAFYVGGLLVLAFAFGRRLMTWPARMKWLPLAALCCIVVLVLDSLGDPALFSWLATTTIAIVAGPVLILRWPPGESGLTVEGGRSR